jgi:glycosyltransferase involved in cell wall biosynthesis
VSLPTPPHAAQTPVAVPPDDRARDDRGPRATAPPAGGQGLRVLMLAPEPFFEPRGTPFSEYHRIKALVEQGHVVDLVTYGHGADVTLPNLRIVRGPRLPLSRVPIGPSFPKILLDLLLVITALRQSRRARYDVVHSHEEAAIFGTWLARRLGIPHLYDMHSSLPQQLANFRFTRSTLLRRLFEGLERRTIARSAVVITICQELQDTVTAMGAGDRAVLVENVMGGDMEPTPGGGRREVRARWGIGPDSPLVLYTGTFEPYQGLALLLDAVARVQAQEPAVEVLIVGGMPDQVAAERARAEALGARVVFAGQRPPQEIPHLVEACDILASPRIAGTNTPLKIYSYLRSGRPIVATRLLTHTQVLDDDTALLVEPTPEAFAAGLTQLLAAPEHGRRLAEGAALLAQSRYSRETYLQRTRQAYARLTRPADPRSASTAAPSPLRSPRLP